MPCKDKDSITLVSDNKAYQPFNVPESEKSAIALVLGAIILEYDRFKREKIAQRAIQKEKKRIQCNETLYRYCRFRQGRLDDEIQRPA